MNTVTAITPSASKRALSLDEQQLCGWLRKQQRAAKGEPLLLKLRHVRSDRTEPIYQLALEDGQEVTEAAVELYSTAVEDVQGMRAAMVQEYVVQAFVPRTVNYIGRYWIKLRGDELGEDALSLEPPALTTLLSQQTQQQMRHNEALVKHQVASVVPITSQYHTLIQWLQQRIDQFEAREVELFQMRAEYLAAREASLSQQAERDRATERARIVDRRWDEAIERVSVLLPAIVNRVAKTPLLPETTTPAMEMLRHFLSSLRPEQVTALQKILSPEQCLPVLELWKTFMAEEELKAERKAASAA